MTELYHVGIDARDVPQCAILVEEGLEPTDLFTGLEPLGDRREYRSYHLDRRLLVLTAGYGSPPLAIALEELARAGCDRFCVVASCRCGDCDHGLVLVDGAVRAEGTTCAYAPLDFPAVPDHALLASAAASIDAEIASVTTVDVPSPSADGPTDLVSAAAFVVGAARGVAVISLVVPAAVPVDAALGDALATVLGRPRRPALWQPPTVEAER